VAGAAGRLAVMLRVGLTGGIGAGKSAVAARLAELGAVIVDSDVLAREVVAPGTPGLAAVVEAFGAGVLDPSGALDRARLGELVFADAGARRRLEGIIHPLVRRRSVELTAAAAADAVVVNDVPLLVEVGLAPTYHLVVVVEADPEVRVERLVGRGLSAAAARARIAAQASDEARRAAADALLDNSGTRDELRAAVDALWAERLVPFERQVRAGQPARAGQLVWSGRPGPSGQPVGAGHVPPGAERLPVVEPDPEWAGRFRRIEGRLRHAAGDSALRVDHIGPTAVPLPASDVIDVQVVVPDLATADRISPALTDAGYPSVPGDWRDDAPPGWAGDPAVLEKRVHGGADPAQLVRVDVRVEPSPVWREELARRDRLRADPARLGA
jgi:dephospho-CoA kinase